ncbi:PP0621 family protein [Alcaligenes sp. SDU_A2]|uniref:PP0621 family protein n=1 Tax=Alcaligenes sp. SDU_A2 TaxID=3136634 RepID=UPI002BBDA7B5|nr:PP0621 family protein [Alcaligenes sp.]HRL26744.1 PP0621 family protein [Alcaligenes sp.]
MGKALFWVVVILAAMIIARIVSHSKARKKMPPNPTMRPPRSQKQGEAMVRCAHCGIHLPRSEALMSNHHTWCSLEHAKRGPRQ